MAKAGRQHACSIDTVIDPGPESIDVRNLERAFLQMTAVGFRTDWFQTRCRPARTASTKSMATRTEGI